MMDANQMVPGLWVGGWSAARDHRLSFDVIVNVAIDAPHNGDYQFSLVDGPGNDPEEFGTAVRCVVSAIREGKQVLVHCVAGMSRSLTVAAKASSIVTGKPIDEVLTDFRAARGCQPTRPFCPHDAMIELARRCEA